MRTDVQKILLTTDLCVLCTSRHDVPDAALMLYACGEGCAKLYMLTLRDTDKHRNILHNPNVSLLVDTRAAAGGSAAWTQALTIRGEASIVEDPAMSTAWIDRLARKHSELTNLAKDPTVCLIEVRLTHILFLENVDKGCDVAL